MAARLENPAAAAKCSMSGKTIGYDSAVEQIARSVTDNEWCLALTWAYAAGGAANRRGRLAASERIGSQLGAKSSGGLSAAISTKRARPSTSRSCQRIARRRQPSSSHRSPIQELSE